MFVDGYPSSDFAVEGSAGTKVLFTLLHEIAHILLGNLEEGIITSQRRPLHLPMASRVNVGPK